MSKWNTDIEGNGRGNKLELVRKNIADSFGEALSCHRFHLKSVCARVFSESICAISLYRNNPEKAILYKPIFPGPQGNGNPQIYLPFCDNAQDEGWANLVYFITGSRQFGGRRTDRLLLVRHGRIEIHQPYIAALRII